MLNLAGIGRYIQDILPCIIDSGEFDVFCLGRKHELARFEGHRRVKIIEIRSKPFALSEHVEIPIRLPAVELYWAPQFCLPCFLPSKARTVVVTIHDVYHLAGFPEISVLKRTVFQSLIRFAANTAHRIITVSNFSKQEILRHTKIDPAKIRVILHGLQPNFNSGYCFKKITDPYVLYVGNVKPHKNVRNVLAAFRKIAGRFPAVKFFVVGKKDGFVTGYRNVNSMLHGIENRVVFMGSVPDDELKNYYANASLFVFPSYYEGFGYPPLEAMSFKIPIIMSNAAALPEVGGDAVIYFDPLNTEDIADKMAGVLSGGSKIDYGKYEERLAAFTLSRSVGEHLRLFREAAASI